MSILCCGQSLRNPPHSVIIVNDFLSLEEVIQLHSSSMCTTRETTLKYLIDYQLSGRTSLLVDKRFPMMMMYKEPKQFMTMTLAGF